MALHMAKLKAHMYVCVHAPPQEMYVALHNFAAIAKGRTRYKLLAHHHCHLLLLTTVLGGSKPLPYT